MRKFTRLFLFVLSFLGIMQTAWAQTLGPAVNPADFVSTVASPVYFIIESAANGSKSNFNAPQDLSGNVIIAPTAAGTLKWGVISPSNVNYALWAVVNDGTSIKLYNKATGLYMTGSRSTAATGETFVYTNYAGTSQYKISTSTFNPCVAYNSNLCDRNSDLGTNSKTAWYFVKATPLTLAIATAKGQLTATTYGSSPGQYSATTRQVLSDAITVAIAARDNNDASDDDAATTTLNQAVTDYLAAKNGIRVSDANNTYWYWIKGTRGATTTSLFEENQGVGKQTLTKDRSLIDAQLWKVVANGNGFSIVSKSDNSYLNADLASGNLGTKATVPTKPLYFNKSSYATDATTFIDYFLVEDNTVSASAAFRMHAGGSSNNYGLMNWTGGISDNCSFQFLAYDPNDVLTTTILDAQTTYTNCVEGTNPGTYPAAARTAFQSVITTAISVNSNPASTSDQKVAQVTALNDAKATLLAARNKIILSTQGNDVWYYIASACASYATGQVLVNQNATEGSPILFTAKSLDVNKLWKFTDAGNGKVYIQNRASGFYIPASPTAAKGTTATPAAFNITYLSADAQMIFNADGNNPIHAQQAGSVLVTWSAWTAGSGSAWKLEQLATADNNKAVSISNITLSQGSTSTGIGNNDQPLIYGSVAVSGLIDTVKVKSVTVDLSGTSNLGAVKQLKLYACGSDNRLKPATHKLLGTMNVPATATTPVEFSMPELVKLPAGTTNLYLAADISETAKEGDLIAARMLNVKYTYLTNRDTTYTLTTSTTPYPVTVFLSQALLYSRYDEGSQYFRIPAIVTAKDGSLVVATDKRNNHNGDLPADIDILIRRSTDNGKTWSPSQMIAGAGTTTGFGDAALLVDEVTGKIFCTCVSNQGLWGSTASNPIQQIMQESSDNGLTWTAPKDITSSIYGANCTDPVRKTWQGGFIASGRGLQLKRGIHAGRLMFVTAMRDGVGLNNYIIYSDDHGATWTCNNKAANAVGGDEAKLVELNDGTVVISIRNGGSRKWNVSTDGGDTWGTVSNYNNLMPDPACNGDIMSYTTLNDGFNKNRTLHINCNSGSRTNVSVKISYNMSSNLSTTTFPVTKTICPGSSGYSTFTVLPDGTIGIYYEDGILGDGYQMVYVRCSLEWLTKGTSNAETFTKGNQTITFNALNPVVLGDADVQLNAKSSAGLAIEYTSSDPSIATIVNGKVHPIKAGEVTIYANQAGSGLYNAAAQVSQALSIAGTNGLFEISNNKTLQVYPNPAKSQIVVNSEVSDFLQIFSNSGQLMKEIQLNAGATKVDINGFKAGVYLLKTSGATTKLNVQK